MNIFILNYVSGTAEVVRDVELSESEDIERFIKDEIGYRIEDISYMCTESDCIDIISHDGEVLFSQGID